MKKRQKKKENIKIIQRGKKPPNQVFRNQGRTAFSQLSF